mgnify:CR=1 FL=1
MNVSYEGIGQWAATFACDGVSAGQVVKVSGSGTVAKCADNDGFEGQRRQSLLCGYGGHGDGKLHRGFRACCWLELFGSGRQRRREGCFRRRQGLSCRGSGYHR